MVVEIKKLDRRNGGPITMLGWNAAKNRPGLDAGHHAGMGSEL